MPVDTERSLHAKPHVCGVGSGQERRASPPLRRYRSPSLTQRGRPKPGMGENGTDNREPRRRLVRPCLRRWWDCRVEPIQRQGSVRQAVVVPGADGGWAFGPRPRRHLATEVDSVQAAPRPEQSFKDLFDTLANQLERVLRGKRRAIHLVARVLVLRRAPPHRRCPRRRQDVARQGDRPLDGRIVATRAIHPRPVAVRCHRRVGLGPGARRLRVPSRRCVRETSCSPTRSTARRPRRSRRCSNRWKNAKSASTRRRTAAAALPRDRDAEPGRARRHVSVAGSAARPVLVAIAHRLSRPRRGDRDSRRARRRSDQRRRARARHESGNRRGVDSRARAHPRRDRAAGLHRRSRRSDPPPPRSDARRESARRAGVAAGVARAGGERRPLVRRAPTTSRCSRRQCSNTDWCFRRKR